VAVAGIIYIYWQMEETFDAVVIGAGPAGLNATLHLLKSRPKPSVLLVDKQSPWEKPIACAEGVWCEPLHEAISVKKEWIRLYISNAVLHSSNGSTITYFDKDKGCILNRPLMQKDMASQCVERGAVVRYNAIARDIGPDDGCKRQVWFKSGTPVFGRVVIDASGPVSSLCRKEKINCKPPDLEPAYFGVVENVTIEHDAIHVYLGREIAPGGYAWAFPREDGTANVGLVVGREFTGKIDIKNLLDSFLRNTFPKANVVRRFAGAIPCETMPLPRALPRLFKAGDAASTVNPISRAGITEALLSGGLAAEFGLAMLNATSDKRIMEICREYQDAWLDKIGKKHGKLSHVKEALSKIPDSDYNKAFAALSAIPRDKLTISRIIGLSLGRFPSLVFAMRHLM
jgi:digeranylgeranylglycerophospholipid reductase